jgi:hypothetical protein
MLDAAVAGGMQLTAREDRIERYGTISHQPASGFVGWGCRSWFSNEGTKFILSAAPSIGSIASTVSAGLVIQAETFCR